MKMAPLDFFMSTIKTEKKFCHELPDITENLISSSLQELEM